MVVSPHALSCFDLLIWLRTGQEAAARLATSQSSVSRKVSDVARAFGVQPRKSDGEWLLEGDPTLLNLERQVHQRFRWERGLPLRIEAQYYSGPLFCQGLSADWIRGNFDFLEVGTPLRHLRDGVIDAWIATYPDLPADDDPDFACFHLIRYPLGLAAPEGHPLLALGGSIRLQDVDPYPTVALDDGAFPKVQAALEALNLWNRSLQRGTRVSLEMTAASLGDPLALSPASLFTCHLLPGSWRLLPLELGLVSGDSLIVRREYASHPRLAALLAHLRQTAMQLAERHGEVELA